jgi:hypothetical protein
MKLQPSKFQRRTVVSKMYNLILPVTVAERSKACTLFARSEAGIMGSNLTQGIYVWYVYVFILCLCCSVFR